MPVATINLFFLIAGPTMHLVEGRETPWRDEGTVQHAVPKIGKHSHCSPVHLVYGPSLGIENWSLLFMLLARFIAEYMHLYFLRIHC